MTLELLTTIWSIRLGLLLLAVVVVFRCHLAARPQPAGGRVWQALRLLWIAGSLLTIVHVVAVFGFVMRWSHQLAIEDTARQTEALIGVSFGGGVYFNYAFLLVWICDAVWWYGWPNAYLRRNRLWDVLVIGYLWFIAFNAAVVFEVGTMRWLGLLATGAIAVVGFQAVVRKRIH